ncbi:MAG: UvrD-helicase domain-containing protein [Myxococcota bacterium]
MTPASPGSGIGDQRVRDQAVTDFSANLVVTAGAGTGKTSLLVERALHAIVQEGVPIERMLALTFTEKAAAEMRIRVAGALERLSLPAPEGMAYAPGDSLEAKLCAGRLEAEGSIAPDQARPRAREALRHLDRARIGTLHGFCADLLRRYPQAAGVDPSFEIDTGHAFDRQFEEAWRAHLAAELGPGAEHSDRWRPVLARYKTDQIRALARALCDFKIPVEQIDPRRDPVDPAHAAAAVSLVLPFAKKFRLAYLQSGFVTFDGLLALARDMLRDRPDVRSRVRESIEAILVDEFQDTDPLQYEIVFFLAEETDGRATDAYQAHLAPGRLFIVGDPKQSIYRFRGADMGAYGRAAAHIEQDGGKRLALFSSFRAPASVLQPLNEMFSRVIGPGAEDAAEYEPPYEPITSALPDSTAPESGVALWSVTSGSRKAPGAEERRLLEGRAIARWIRESVDAGRVACSGVVLLFRALTNVDPYLGALREWDVPFVVQGGSAFHDRPEVAELVSLLRAIVNPNDPVALLGVLRSPLGGCPDTELMRLRARGHAISLTSFGRFDKNDFPAVSSALGMLQDLREKIRTLPVDEGLRAVLAHPPLLELNACSYHGAQRIANLRRLIDRIAGIALRESLSLEATLDMLDREVLAAGGEGDSPLADETVEAVRVLTIHSAKGLEFPIVFLPDLAREDKSRRMKGVARWVNRPGTEAGSGAATLALNLGDEPGAAWVEAEGEEDRHRVAEEKRIFYVACTRARDTLILVNGHPKPRSSSVWIKHVGAWGYGVAGEFPPEGVLNAGVRHKIVTAPGRRESNREAVDVTPLADAVRRFERDRASAVAASFERLRAPSGIRENLAPAGEDEERPRAPSADRGRLTGIAVHAALAAWDFRDPADLANHLAAASRNACAGAPAEAEAVRENGRRVLAGFLDSDLPERFARAEIMGREVPMLLAEGDTTWWGWIDVILKENGRIIVADWKTDADRDFPKTGPQRYAGQLGVYARGVRDALGLPDLPGCELIHVPTATVVPVRIP